MDPCNRSSSSDVPTSAPPTIRQRLLRFLFNAIFLIAFLGVMGTGVMLFLNRQWLGSVVLVSLGLMSIPFAEPHAPVRERVLVSLVMPFGLYGIIAGVAVYFQLFRFRWFEALFNNKGSGEAGLAMAVILGAPLGWYVGFRLVVLCFGPISPQQATGDSYPT